MAMPPRARVFEEMKIQQDSQLNVESVPMINQNVRNIKQEDPNRGIHFHASDPLSRMTNKEKQFFLPYLPQPKVRTLKQAQKMVSTPQTSGL
jgi:hypothetical protein